MANAKKKEAFFHNLCRLDGGEETDFLDAGLTASMSFLKSKRRRAASSSEPSTGLPGPIPRQTAPVSEGITATLGATRPYFANSTHGKSQAPAAPAILRSVSAPQQNHGKHQEENIQCNSGTNIRGNNDRPSPNKLKHTVSLPALSKKTVVMTAASAMPRAVGRKKRPGNVQLVPEGQRIFAGLSFYFFPNNDVHPARRLRIAKTIQYGARWIKDWSSDGITHVIADKDMNYGQILEFLKLSSLPVGVIVVNEVYPADCITYRTLLDPLQSSYEVNGYKEVAKVVEPSTCSSSTPQSLQVKAPKARQPVYAENTPSVSEQNEDISAPADDPLPSKNPNSPDGTRTEINSEIDALDQAISDIRGLECLPLDLEDEDERSEVVDESDQESGNESAKERARKRQRLASKSSWQDTFQCMHKHEVSGLSENPNARTIEVLEQMKRYYEQVHDNWRPVAYRRAIASLRKQNRKVVTKEDALALQFVGERLAAKIEEIVWTDKLRRLENTRLEPADEILQSFLKIYGVGFSQASRWVSQGYRTLDDLLERVTLTENQKIGIAHYDDFQARIPRAEVRAHGEIVEEALKSIDPDFQVMIMGSYRRGAVDSGDIDLIITSSDASISQIRTVVLDTLVPNLFEQGFLKAGLARTNHDDGSKWHGASALPGSSVWRRIDLLLVPGEEIGAALIYFTGNDIFNRSIRLLASKKGMRLNQRGLYKDVMRGQGRRRVTDGTLVEGRSERKIFEILGVPWREPHHRIC